MAAGFANAVSDKLNAPFGIVLAPAFRIAALKADAPQARIDHVVFTSRNGVIHAPRVTDAVAWCVGDATAQAARQMGYRVMVADGDADALVALMTQRKPQGSIVHFAGRHRRGQVAQRLRAAGLTARTITVYAQIDLDPPDDLVRASRGSAPLVVPVFSPRSGRALLSLSPTADIHLIAISAAVAAEMAPLQPVSVLTLDKPDADAMVAATIDILRRMV